MARTLFVQLAIDTEEPPCDPTATKDNDVVSPAVGSPEEDVLAFVDALRKSHKTSVAIWQSPGTKTQMVDAFEIPTANTDPIVIKRRVTF